MWSVECGVDVPPSAGSLLLKFHFPNSTLHTPHSTLFKRIIMFAKLFKRSGMPTKQYVDSPIIAWNGLHQPKWTQRHMSAMADEGFRKNVIAYRCITQIAMSAATVPLLAYDARGREIAKHPMLDLLSNPNPLQDGFAFFEAVYANLQIFGNAFIEVIRDSSKSRPSELYSLRPDRMKVIPSSGALPEGYVYSVDNRNTSWSCDSITGESDILHIKSFHPLDDWYGFAPLEAAMQSIDQHNSSGAWNQALLNQGARPSGALVYSPKDGTPASLSDEQVVRLREQISQMYQSYQNAGRPLILEGGLDWKEMSLSPKDMDWLSGRNNAARDIALAFGVPSQLIGIPDTQTYANMEQARIAFYEETIIPQLTKVVFSFDRWLCPMYEDNPCLDFDIDSINALVEKRQTQWAKIDSASFLTQNEKRQAAGYGAIRNEEIGK